MVLCIFEWIGWFFPSKFTPQYIWSHMFYFSCVRRPSFEPGVEENCETNDAVEKGTASKCGDLESIHFF